MTSVSSQDSLSEKVASLERSLRRIKLGARLALLLALGLLSVGLAGAAGPATKGVEPDRILLKDAQGRVRMTLQVGEEGPAITMLDGDGKLRAHLGVMSDGPALDLLDESETPRAQLVVTEKQGPILNLYDMKGTQVTIRP